MTTEMEAAHSFLVHPAKGDDDQPEIGGTQVPKSGKLAEMLQNVFERAPNECNIEIVFRPNDEGQQENKRRNQLVQYLLKPNLPKGREVARGLQEVTTNRSGLGLLFLLAGTTEAKKRLVVSRFPADQGVIAEEDRQSLSVEFIERVFMKSAKAYKSVMYESDSPDRGFWDGRAIDKQITGLGKELSDYWILEFLCSELRTTGPAGTKRIAVALGKAISSAPDLPVRQELVAAAMLMGNRGGQTKSGRQLVDELGLSQDAASVLEHQLPRADLLNETFTFNQAEFGRQLAFRSVELDNGAILLADRSKFAEVFSQEPIDAIDTQRRYRFSTEGSVINETIRKSK